ncbi:S8 family serine peptidase [Flavobacterium sp.]|uniref:S8 family serine peptidase n=1 Tax=Flavobacterium sp. TaxID=239 RepID=UPI00248744A6|nr:S8 family serine peptidase [Flavobacterium sp.]MDI1316555.1 S8 family serine peptidase [Flavobacterium sp.]
MKYILLFSFVFCNVFSQTQKERDFIISKSDPVESFKLKQSLQQEYLKDQKEVRDYLLQHPNTKNATNLQKIIDGVPIFYQEDSNALCVQTLRANSMYPSGSLGLSVTGQGMTIGMWDGGRVRETHVEFATGRLTLGDAVVTLSTHSTHVLGTMIAAGISPTRRGFAYQASAIAYDFGNDSSEIATFASQGYVVSNHSYGNIATNLPQSSFGAYNSQSVSADNIMVTYPFYQMVKSAGNDRNDTTLDQATGKGGYDLLTGVGNSKNAIVVAAVEGIMTNGNDNSFVMSNFSNWGPTDDGRIKPDLSAKGVAVSSCISVSDNAYSELQGTSMSAPCITGLITLLQKHYNNLNPGTFMRSATVRALLFQSAREAGDNPGPDYRFGWGLPDGSAAAQIITNKNISSILEENTLNNSQVYTKTITINSVQNLSVDIAWTERIGIANNSGDIDNRTPVLVNNLDLKVLKDGTTYYPWKLDPEDPEAGATNNSDNDVDNSERVNISNAQPGVYTIQVTHKGTLVGGSQNYSLVATSTNGLGLNSRDYDNSVFIYPNPAQDVLNFEIKSDVILSDISLSDISGKQIYKSTNAIGNSIDVSNLSSGVYFITFKSDSNSITKKFIKR